MGVMGTSFAAPHVSGAAALLYEATKSATAARDAILNTAEDLGGPREAQGRGLLRIDRALGRIRETNQWTEAAAPLLGLIGLAAVPLIGILSAAAREAKIERLRTLYRTGQITYIQLYTLYQRGEITQDTKIIPSFSTPSLFFWRLPRRLASAKAQAPTPA